MIAIIGSGIWLLYQPSDTCLGNKSVGMIYGVVGGSFIFMIICCGCCGKDDGRMTMAVSCSSFGLFLIIIYMSVYALIYSTIAFGSLNKEITSPETWMDIKYCLYQQTKLCSHFQHNYANDSPNQFFARDFPLIQSGCCKPPEECNMNFSSPTVWIETGNGTYSNADCYKWDNDPKKLCYNCEVCKQNFAQDVKKTWSISSCITVLAWLMIVLVITFILISNRRDNYTELV
ncbi:unnamed protein product [Amaranthus hypochondriacus]